MTTPPVPHRFELELEVPGTPEQVWDAIATAEGISAWMMPTDLDAREGGEVVFHMGPDEASHGRVTGFEPSRRFAFEEDWATLTGNPDAEVTPLLTEFLVEARSGGTCVVKVVTSAFGTGADWENEFWTEMEHGWGPVLDNLRIYLSDFPGRRATSMWVTTTFPSSTPEAAIASVRDGLGGGELGSPVAARGLAGRVARSTERHVLVRGEQPVEGLLSFFAFGAVGGAGIHLQAHLFGDEAEAYVAREQSAWQAWLDGLAADAAA